MSNAYSNASLLVTPNGYEAGTIFSAKPTDGSGDLSFSRASTALRRNSAGLWESVANNVPRLHYPVGGGCPSWLFEPQSTNSFLNSNAPATQVVTVANATVYTISVRGIGVATLSGAATGVITGTNSEGSSLTVTTSSNSLIVTVTGLSGTVYVQVETGSIATSPIITAGSAVTRVVENYSRALSAMNQGSAIVKIPDNIILSGGGTHLFGIFILAGTGIGVYLSRVSNGRSRLWTQAAANIFQTTVDDLKLGITWNGTSINVWQNGVKVVTDYSFALTGVVNLLSSNGLETFNLIDEIILYNTVLSDVEMGDLTQ
jgi:hypothetical protein